MVSVRARVIIIRGESIAMIARRRGDRRYYVFPGGGVEPGETIAAAAVREAAEELGLVVALGRRVVELRHGDVLLHFFLATPLGGTLGTGRGPEFTARAAAEHGTYRAVWLPLDDLPAVEVLPVALVGLLAAARAAGWAWPPEVISVVEGAR